MTTFHRLPVIPKNMDEWPQWHVSATIGEKVWNDDFTRARWESRNLGMIIRAYSPDKAEADFRLWASFNSWTVEWLDVAPLSDVTVCDECGVGVGKDAAHWIGALTFPVASANVGESAVLCGPCFDAFAADEYDDDSDYVRGGDRWADQAQS